MAEEYLPMTGYPLTLSLSNVGWPLVKVHSKKLIVLYLNQNICCGYECSFEHPKHILKLIGKKIFTVLRSKFVFI